MSPPINKVDVTDPMSVAVALATLQGEFTRLHQLVAGLQQSVDGDMRRLSDQVTDVVRLQQAAVNHSEGLNRAFQAIEKITTSFEGWKDKHETENRSVAESVTDFRGRIRGVWMAGGLVVFLGTTLITFGAFWVQRELAGLDKQFADGAADRARIETQRAAVHEKDVVRLQAQLDQLKSEVESMRDRSQR